MKVIYISTLFISIIEIVYYKSIIACELKTTKYGKVCVCTPNKCDYTPNPILQDDKDLVIISSSKNGLRFATTYAKFDNQETILIKDYNDLQNKKLREYTFDPIAISIGEDDGFVELSSERFYFSRFQANATANLYINRKKHYQTIVGFGGAFTGAVSYNLLQLPISLQDHIYKSFYHNDGIGFNILRYTIGGCDFDLAPWAYNEYPKFDTKLTNFTRLDERDEIKVQQIKRLKQISDIAELKIIAAAWSSPPWMKTNNDWTGYGFLKREYYQLWADYHLKFLELMDAKNITFWAISTGNEPQNGSIIGSLFIHFMSLGWTSRNQAIWLSENFGPTLKNSKFKNILIFSNDDQRYTYPTWFQNMKSTRPKSLDYIDGFAVHWYWDNMFAPNLIDDTMRLFPNKLFLNTESSIGDKPWQTHGPELGSWERSEQYILSYINSLQHAYNGWIDWNIILDEEGGPNYVNNFVDAPIIVNTTNRNEFYKQPIYYAIGHFSKFITENSVRIETHITNINIDSIGFQRPDGSIVVILFNGDRVPATITLNDSIRGNKVINIPAHSIHTIIYR